MQVVILAGGKGTRLAERLAGRPKPLIDVDGVPLLQRQIETLKAQGATSFLVLVNHAADQIADFLAVNDNFGCEIALVDDGEPRGTAGAVLACLDLLADRFLIVYGDTLFSIDLPRFLAAHEAARADATLFLHPNDHPHDSDLVEVRDGLVTGFHPYPHPAGALLPNLVNAAFYVMERAALEPWRDFPVPADFGKDLFQAMLDGGARLAGYRSFEYIKDLGTPKRLDKVERHLRSGLVARASLQSPQKAVFLDRDGTLNVHRGYVTAPEQLDLVPGAAEALHRLNDLEYRALVVTNQPVIARGDCSEDDLRVIHNKLETLLGQAGAYLDDIYLCPHHPDGGYPGERPELKIKCDCRKPNPGLIRRAAEDYNIDLHRSWMVGDTTSDLMAAQRAGVASILVLTGEAGRDGKHPVSPDFIADDVGAAVEFIAAGYPALAERSQDLLSDIAPGDLVLVGGLAKSGKSTLASMLARELRARGQPALSISLDRWIVPAATRDGGDVLSRFETEAALEALQVWLDGGALSTAAPFYDRVRRERTAGGLLEADAGATIILEGVPALTLEPKTQRRILRLFVDLAEDRRRARVETDLMNRLEISASQAQAIYLERTQDESPLIAATARRADRHVSF